MGKKAEMPLKRGHGESGVLRVKGYQTGFAEMVCDPYSKQKLAEG